jgi:hypothetical protein
MLLNFFSHDDATIGITAVYIFKKYTNCGVNFAEKSFITCHKTFFT